MSVIHPSALIEPGARLADDVHVGPFCWVRSGAVIGSGCRLVSHVSVHSGVTVGPRCVMHAGVVLGDEPQDLGFKSGTASFVEIGEGTVLREGVTVHVGTKEGTVTRIGRQCYLMANSHVAHNCTLADHVILANGALLGGYVEIGERCFISGNAMVHQFVRIGRLAMLGGGTGASKDVPPFCITRGVSLNQVTGLNTTGLRRAGFDAEARLAVKRAFKAVYFSNQGTREAARAVLGADPTPAQREFAEFILASKRGVSAGPDILVDDAD